MSQDEMRGNYTLILKGLSKKAAIEIGNDQFGDLVWSKEKDGVVRAYPFTEDKPFEIRQEGIGLTDPEDQIKSLVEAAKYVSDVGGCNCGAANPNNYPCRFCVLESALKPFKEL